MKTEHKVYNRSAELMQEIPDESVSLIITSPPYPMIDMWEESFQKQSIHIDTADESRIRQSFDTMHRMLNKVWQECFRVLLPGAFLCINIGDATRTINGNFRLFSNHTRILQDCQTLGFFNLPNLIWRKQTNAPNKFMGSGMLPAGAYVTLEHEYILIFRKPGKRIFNSEAEKKLRKESAFFWEERNNWFSDIWFFNGTTQGLTNSTGRERSGAFPLELPHRLINMYSLQGDTILDPFLGTGTTSLAAMLNARNSLGYEIDASFLELFDSRINGAFIFEANRITAKRLQTHLNFIEEYKAKGKEPKYTNIHYDFPVITNQETELKLYSIRDIIKQAPNRYLVSYGEAEPNEQYTIF